MLFWRVLSAGAGVGAKVEGSLVVLVVGKVHSLEGEITISGLCQYSSVTGSLFVFVSRDAVTGRYCIYLSDSRHTTLCHSSQIKGFSVLG